MVSSSESIEVLSRNIISVDDLPKKAPESHSLLLPPLKGPLDGKDSELSLSSGPFNDSNIWEKNNKVTTNVDQPSTESLLALAPEPLSLSSVDWNNDKETIGTYSIDIDTGTDTAFIVIVTIK